MIDWTDAFDNSSYVAGSDELPAIWAERAANYRDEMMANGLAELAIAYGAGERNIFDLFLPDAMVGGLVVFVHGGYWHRMDRSFFSHLAEGARARGWAVAMPSYTLAPRIGVSGITREIAAAIEAAANRIDGPLRIAGHSAGGHLVSRMACADGHLREATAARLERVLSISGIHDLRPLLLSQMNATLGLTEEEAATESPVLHEPRANLPVRFRVGAAERPELLRQTRLIAETWGRAGADVDDDYLRGEDHFTIIEALARPESGLVETLLA